ncbi:AAEL004066-PA [Aedes aegypti]|uniref:AAEL004066-PA n=1 Tax=Aedes aegypti TaxID=7159 RepID=Q17DQ5_AEDAE|nr:AAEL004066-PA [Aedes aegypti]
MLAEDLPTLLQNLLVGIERAICRVPLEELSFPTQECTTTTINDEADDRQNNNGSLPPEPSERQDKYILTPGTPKIGLKRRELITKNKLINNKYALKRIASTTTPPSANHQNGGNHNNTNGNSFINCNESVKVGKSENTSRINGNQCNSSLATPIDGERTKKEDDGSTKLCDTGGSTAVGIVGGGGSDNHQSTTTASNPLPTPGASGAADSNSMPLFCLGGSFPHIDSDEESGDDMKRCETGTYDRSGSPLIYIEAEKVLASGLNCYEIATVLLYYNTLPIQRFGTHFTNPTSTTCAASTGDPIIFHYSPLARSQPNPRSPSQYCIHLLLTESSQLAFLETLDSALQLLSGHLTFGSIYVSGSYDPADNKHPPKELIRNLNVHIKYLNNETIKNFIGTDNLPIRCAGFYVHDQREWIDFFRTLEPLQIQCVETGRRLVTVLNDIRNLEIQGTTPTRRQLHSQHRALSRALMDSELQTLRRKGPNTIQRLQDKLTVINNKQTLKQTKNVVRNCSLDSSNRLVGKKDLINARLGEVITIFQEVDRAARKLEQLTEQRRERLREMTRQRALDDEINEVISWIRNEGTKTLQDFNEHSCLENAERAKVASQEFEKFYFMSMKHISKGRDLYEASVELEILKDTLRILKDFVDQHKHRLENTRERMEGVIRLHELLESLRINSQDGPVLTEILELAEKVEVPSLIEQCKQLIQPSASNNSKRDTNTNTTSTSDNISLDISLSDDTITATSTPEKGKFSQPTLIEQNGNRCNHNHGRHHHDEDEEEQSKMADSGLGGCDRCEGNEKLERTCSCQSLNDPKNGCNNGDDLDEDCFEANSKPSLDLQIPLQANAHLYCHASNLQLDYEENNIFDQKTQKTLLLIMREMIGTERDYVRSLQYVIENYTQELLREDIPQALRGQRNVIFGNIERICEFHQQHFLSELESCEHHPIKVGSAFLRHESKFYLYALYNKNKPKSDSLMSENGTQFFKAKQMELNDKMDLASYLLKPVQRMGKYALLLQQLMKACSAAQETTNPEILEDMEELQKAEEMVRFQLRHGNDLLAMDSLRDCDVNVKEQGRLLRQNEFLVWEGKAGKKSLRQVFLFEELVLFSKARRFPDRKNLDIYIYKNSIKTSDIGLTAHIGDSPYKFEIWFRKRKPGDTWTLQTMSEDIKNAWTDEISKLLWKQAKRNREIRLAEMSSMGIGSKPCLDIRPSQDQINDRSISISMFGKTPKLRNSFIGTLPESKSSKRPQSIISVSSSSSGSSVVSTGTGSTASGCETIPGKSSGSAVGSSSAVSSGCSTSSTSSSSTTASITTCKRLTLSITDPNAPAPLKTNFKKHQRSTTLVSQCSMESGIIADISLSPDEALENPLWPQQKNHTLLRKSHSVASTSQEHNKIPESTPKPKELPVNGSSSNNSAAGSTSSHSNSSNSDMITVHL